MEAERGVGKQEREGGNGGRKYLVPIGLMKTLRGIGRAEGSWEETKARRGLASRVREGSQRWD